MAGNPNPSPATRFGAERSNPSGRKMGSRDRLSSKFFEALAKIFDESGEQGLRDLAAKDGATFFKMISSVQPKQVEERHDPVGDMADERLDELIEMANAERERRQNTVQ